MLPRAAYPELALRLRCEFIEAMNGKYVYRKRRDPIHATSLTYLFMDLIDEPEDVICSPACAARAMMFLGLAKGGKLCSV